MTAAGPLAVLEECKRLVWRLCGSKRGVFLNILAAGFVAWGLPWFLGVEFLRAVVLIPLASLSVFLVSDAVLDTFAERPAIEEFAPRIFACLLVGWGSGLAILFSGLAAMNAMFWSGEPMLPPPMILIDAAVFSLSASVLAAGAALTLLGKLKSVSAARTALKALMLAVVLGLLYGCSKAQAEGLLIATDRRITQLTWMASIFFLANGAALIALAANDPRFPRRKTPADSS